MTSLLKGYRVIESSMLLNGAVTGMMLVDLGAEVIKVENTGTGDYLRLPETAHLNRQSNRAKRSIAIDLKSDEGKDVFYRLLDTADVFLTNAVGDKNDRIGIGYEQLKARKPGIIYCQNTGFGATGPWRMIPTHGHMMDAIAGALPAEISADGLVVPKSFRRRAGSMTAAGEGVTMGAIYAAFHIAAALAHRERTGEGCYIDVSSAHAAVASAWTSASNQMNRPERAGWWLNEENLRPVARYQGYRTRDGRFLLFCPEEAKFWHAFCDLVGRPDLKPEERGEPLRREIQTIIEQRDLAEWMVIAQTHRLPFGPMNDGIDEVRADPQISSRGLFADIETETGRFTHIGQPAMVDGKANVVTAEPPAHGEHGDAILAELGYSGDEVAKLNERGITKPLKAAQRAIISALYGDEKPEK
jgi:formyl-CoA transferase